ncbi:MAG: hypothetical protein EZS28_004205 [Streblomastix strix]|uniref:Uncharacterized protein n=1 Tax=Streblomastix strix TaxID=222440 RepID=A0A5J4X1C1_9EUKA|nr:MAG: hypothetical protein EZS28_004205 [Streblomastix strix]
MAEQASIKFDRDMEEMKAKINEFEEQIQQKDNENKQLEAHAVPDGYQTEYIFAVQVEDDDENDNAVLNIRRRNKYCTSKKLMEELKDSLLFYEKIPIISRTYPYRIVSLSEDSQKLELNRMLEIDFNALQKEAREEFEAEKSQYGSGGADGQGLMEVDGMEDDYDYYESQAARQDRMKSRAKPFGRLPFLPSMILRTKKHAGPQFREEAGDVLATLVVYLNRDIKKINRLSSAVSAQKYENDKHLGNQYSVVECDLDNNVVTPDNVVNFDKKKNAIYSVDDYTTAVGFGDLEHQHKRNWKKKYYSDINDLERATLAAKLKQQGIKGGPYMKWLSMTTPHKERTIKLHSFRAFTVEAKKIHKRQWRRIIANGYQTTNNGICMEFIQQQDLDKLLRSLCKYYCQILTQRQQRIGGYDLAKYNWPQLFIKVFDSIHPIHTVQSKVIHQQSHFFVLISQNALKL